MSTNVIKRTPAAGGPSYNPGDAFHVPDHGLYGPRPRDFHVGIDYAAPAGTPVPAASSGEVVYSGPSRGFHHAVMVKSTGPDGHNYYSVYGHVDSESALPVGTRVAIGQPIGAVGTPHTDEGEATTGPHIHYQIATERKLLEAHVTEVPGSGGLGFKTGMRDLFENPDEFKGWATEDKAPYNALTYVPIRDGATFQPVPNVAQASQADQRFSHANSFNPPGLSPAEINRFYSETGRFGAGLSESPVDASRGAAGPNTATGISQAGIDRLYNFTQLGRSATTPSAADGLNAPDQTASAPWYSSPAVTGDYTPTENFNWNKVPTGSPGNHGSLPLGGSGNAPAPALRVPQQDRRSAAPDDPAWASAQGAMPTTPTSPQNAAYSPAGSIAGNFIRTAAVAAPPLPAPSNVLGFNPDLWMASDPAAAARSMRNLAGGASRFIGAGLPFSAQAASPSNPLWPSATTALDRFGNPGFSGGLPGRLAAVLAGVDPTMQSQPAASQSNDGTQGPDENLVRRLSRSDNNNSPALVADANAPAPLFVLPGGLKFDGDLAGLLANLASFSFQNRA
jgi:Peptidase family M23